MSLTVSMRGAEKFDELSRKLKAAGRDDLRRELNRQLRPAANRLETAVKAAVPPHMPRGYEAPLTRSLRFRLSRRTGAAIGLTVTMSGSGRHVVALNQGRLRHPVFGRRRRTTRGKIFNNPWVLQPVPPGFFTKPAERVLARAQDDAVRAIDNVLAKLGG